MTPPGRVSMPYPCRTMPNRHREHWHLFRGPRRTVRATPQATRQTRAVVSLATKLDISTANPVDVAIGLPAGDSGQRGRGWEEPHRARWTKAPRLHRRGASVDVGDAERSPSAV